ncbi:MAG: hypothetical protein PHF46_01675 [Candidatus Gracilibacteria bacterium]|nr:hypothetical protein [Candidatus Gracilibacteria bacterium]MDD3120099.1 hypothetical protein [Candidatus Gracilibacteria bacterium]MDD4530430.1 hypothetical protein [Candidatus Gracilibacteria bacterium]
MFKVSENAMSSDFIVLDIGTYKIKVLICNINEGNLTLLGSAEVPQAKSDIADGEIVNLSGVSNTIKKAILKAGENLSEIPDDIVVCFNSQYLIYNFIGMNYLREDKNSPIKMSEIDDMIKKVEYKSIEKIKTKAESRVGIIDCEMKLITTSITSISIDGQRFSNPVGFTGKNIRFNLINVFAPVSKYNIFSSLIRNLNKNLISIIPIPISLPKLVESSPFVNDQNLFIDFGYSKTTVILQDKSEILGFNVINFGWSLLEEQFKNDLNLSYFEIREIMLSPDINYEKHKKIFDDFFNVLFDAIFIAIFDIAQNAVFRNIFLSGSSVTDLVKTKLKDFFNNKDFNKIKIYDPVIEENTFKDLDKFSFASTVSAAKAGIEIFDSKKDPIAKILRYIIYRYE